MISVDIRIYLQLVEMRLPPSVVSLIESHLGILPPTAVKPTTFKAITANSQPRKSGRLAPTLTPTRALNPPRSVPSPRHPSRQDQLPRRPISFEDALERYPTKPQVALGAAHRLLNDQQSAPSTSSRIDYIVRKQRLYERIIRAFASNPTSAEVTISSIYQRLLQEDIPPSTEILKIVLGTALKNGTPIMPILRSLVGRNVGLPEEVDTHLLLLVIKGMAREVNIEPKELERVMDDCLSTKRGERPMGFDEILVESYGRKGDLRSITNLLSRHAQRPSRGVLSLYIKALTQWIDNPDLRRKRRGSLFPRALAKDLIKIYGGAEKLPLEWLNAWMNGERIANNLKTALNVWNVITSSTQPDQTTYSIYFRLLKLLPPDEGYRLRQAVKSLLDVNQPKFDIKLLEHALGAAFTHNDLPLVLLLARQLDYTPDQHLKNKLSPSARVIDILSAGFIRSQRPSHVSRPRSNTITPQEWQRITRLVNIESGLEISLPLNTPQAGLVEAQGASGDYIGRYKPGSRIQTEVRASIVKPLLGLLERAVVLQHGGNGSGQEILREVMREVNSEVLP
jgi:hypothetical protein